jgi:hypothetical protein
LIDGAVKYGNEFLSTILGTLLHTSFELNGTLALKRVRILKLNKRMGKSIVPLLIIVPYSSESGKATRKNTKRLFVGW